MRDASIGREPSPLRALLRARGFRGFLVANGLERLASSAMTVLLGLQVWELTHNPLDLGLLGAAEAIPGVTLVLYGGHVADRVNRWRVVIATSLLLALLGGLIAAASAVRPSFLLWLLFFAAFLGGVVRAFENPAASGLEAQVVPRAHVMRGVAVLATSSRLADLSGPIVGTAIWPFLGAAWTYGVIGGLFALAALAFRLDPAPPAPVDDAPRAPAGAGREIVEGVRHVFSDQVLVGSMALDLFAVFFGGATALLPVFATDVLGIGAFGLGLLRAAMATGSFTASLLAGRFLPRARAGLALHVVIGGFGVSMIVFGLSRSLPLSLAALFVAGVCDGSSVIVRRAILRLAAPEAMRGRIAAVKSVFVGSSNEIGALESGLAATLLGATAAVWTGGIATLAIVATTAMIAPRLRRLDLDRLEPMPVRLRAADTVIVTPRDAVTAGRR